jgi:hypothetical protein
MRGRSRRIALFVAAIRPLPEHDPRSRRTIHRDRSIQRPRPREKDPRPPSPRIFRQSQIVTASPCRFSDTDGGRGSGSSTPPRRTTPRAAPPIQGRRVGEWRRQLDVDDVPTDRLVVGEWPPRRHTKPEIAGSTPADQAWPPRAGTAPVIDHQSRGRGFESRPELPGSGSSVVEHFRAVTPRPRRRRSPAPPRLRAGAGRMPDSNGRRAQP